MENERTWQGFGSIDRRAKAANWKAAIEQRRKMQAVSLAAETQGYAVAPVEQVTQVQQQVMGEILVPAEPRIPTQDIIVLPKANRLTGRWG